MKKFQFKFDTILRVKEKREELLKHEFMKLNALKLEEEKILSDIKEKRAYISREKSDSSTSGVDIQSLIYFEQYLTVLLNKIDQTKKNIKEFEMKADSKREEVVEASKEKKVFEKLKERQFDQFKRMIIFNEQQVLDEAAISKFNRKEQKSY
jgi:flagellar FliJ protein